MSERRRHAHASRGRHRHHRGRRGGFTLVELLVVLGIIVVLVAIGLPMLAKARQAAARTRVAADLATISTALDAYKGDFGDYPRVPDASTGAAVLCKALMGPGNAGDFGPAIAFDSAATYMPGDMVLDGGTPYVCIRESSGAATSDTDYWVPFNPADGADGFGFRTQRLPGADAAFFTADDVIQGKTWPPYLNETQSRRVMNLVDGNGLPILYFPSSGKKLNLSGTVVDVTTGNPVGSYVDVSASSLYDAADGGEFFRQFTGGSLDTAAVAMARMRAMLGDLNNDGLIGAGETAAHTGPYLLWAAGTDQLFGPLEIDSATPADVNTNRTAAGDCDDVTNFGP